MTETEWKKLKQHPQFIVTEYDTHAVEHGPTGMWLSQVDEYLYFMRFLLYMQLPNGDRTTEAWDAIKERFKDEDHTE